MDNYDIEIREKVKELVEFINIQHHIEDFTLEEQDYWTNGIADRICEISQDILLYCIFEYFGYDFDDIKDLIIKGGEIDE